MLVCNVSLRAPRAAIPAGVIETATAVDGATTGNIVFATLVDDPANVGAVVDAYLGEIMVEAASATAAVNAGLTYTAAILEEATATATAIGEVPTIVPADVAEAVTASETVSATQVALTRSAMLPRAFVNGVGSREALIVGGTMVNL